MARKKGPRIKIPRKAKKGQIIQVKTTIGHPMETGWRKDKNGKVVAKNRIEKFICEHAGKTVFSADFFSGVSINPYLSFYAKALESGTFDCTWIEDTGKKFTKSAKIKVS